MTTETIEVPRLHVFHSTTKYMQTVTPTGRKILFIGGVFYTKHPEEIEFLNAMCNDSERGIYVVASEKTIAEADRDPMTALRNKLRTEILAEMQAQINPSNDRGFSEQGRLNPANTRDSAAVAAGGDATSMHEQVARLIPGKTSK